MSDELTTAPPLTDGFDIDDESGPEGRRVIQGTRLRFTNNATWINADEEEIARSLELVVVDHVRVLQKWINQLPAETRFLEPGEKWPDLKKLNDAAPKSEWREDPNGTPQGPWQCQHVLYLLNLETLDRYTYPTNTVGGHRFVDDLKDRIRTMRRLRGQHVYPVVTLTKTFMPTRHGGRQRPHFVVQRWAYLDSGREVLPATKSNPAVQQLRHFAAEQPAEKPVETPPAQPAPAAKKHATRTTKRGVVRTDLKTVAEPSIEEVLDDEIPFE